MTNSVYKINKGINHSIEFKGFKAQYIWYLGGLVVGLLIFFAIIYAIGINTYLCLITVFLIGTISALYIKKLSDKHGEYGMLKKNASKLLPGAIITRSRQSFSFSTNPKK